MDPTAVVTIYNCVKGVRDTPTCNSCSSTQSYKSRRSERTWLRSSLWDKKLLPHDSSFTSSLLLGGRNGYHGKLFTRNFTVTIIFLTNMQLGVTFQLSIRANQSIIFTVMRFHWCNVLKNNPGKLRLFILTPLLLQSAEWTISCDFIQESFTENALDSLT